MIKPLDLEVLKSTEPKPVPWIVPGIAASGALTLLYGPPGGGKSIVLMDLSRAVSEGGEFLGIKCKENKVLNLDAENGEEEIHRRVAAISFDRNYNPVVLTDFSIEINIDALEDLLWEAMPGVVILDSLRTLWTEGAENESGSVTRMLVGLQTLARKFSVAIVLIHHTNRAGDFRGSGAFTAVPDVAVHLGRNYKDKDETRRYLRWEKCRLGPAPNKKWFAIQSNDFGQVKVLESCQPAPSDLWSDD